MEEGLIEGKIKRELTQIHKSLLGKGPDNVTVRLHGNILSIVYQGSLTPLEESIMSVENGKEVVNNIRDKLFEHRWDFFKELFEKHTGVPVDNMTGCFSKDYCTLYYFVIFERNVKAGAN